MLVIIQFLYKILNYIKNKDKFKNLTYPYFFTRYINKRILINYRDDYA